MVERPASVHLRRPAPQPPVRRRLSTLPLTMHTVSRVALAIAVLPLFPSPAGAQFPTRRHYAHDIQLIDSYNTTSGITDVELLSWWTGTNPRNTRATYQINFVTEYPTRTPPADTYGLKLQMSMWVRSTLEPGEYLSSGPVPSETDPRGRLTIVLDRGERIPLAVARLGGYTSPVEGVPGRTEAVQIFYFTIPVQDWLRVIGSSRFEIEGGPFQVVVTDLPRFEALKDFTSRLRQAPGR